MADLGGSINSRNLKIVQRQTGCMFDKTAEINPSINRPGIHKPNSGPVDQTAFNQFHKETSRPDPRNFQPKGTTVLRRDLAKKKTPAQRSPRSRSGKNVAFKPRANPPNTEMRRFYERGDLPVQIDHGGVKNTIQWKIEIEKLDYHHYLPLFFSGLRETEEPYAFLAEQGIIDMLSQSRDGKVLPVLPQLIIPIKDALNTRDMPVVIKTLKILQRLAHCEELIGQALVPYYRQILPVLNIFLPNSVGQSDDIEYDQRRRMNSSDLIMETLQIFESVGGEDAFINIKYMVPIYQSCIDS